MRFHPPHPVQGMPTITIALLAEALRRAESHQSDRARLAVRLQAVAEVSGFGIPRPPAGAQPGWLRLPLLLPDRRASEVLPVDLGVVRPYQRPLGEQHEVASVVQNARAAMPGAGVLAARLVTIPVHRFVDATDEARLQRWLQRGA
jgi:dTDP-4-amino-4,6-dideoxygalactose transaminase